MLTACESQVMSWRVNRTTVDTCVEALHDQIYSCHAIDVAEESNRFRSLHINTHIHRCRCNSTCIRTYGADQRQPNAC